MKRIFAIILMALLLPVSAMGVTFQINVPDYNAGIGTDLQAYDAELTALAGLTFADKSIIQLTGPSAAAVLTCTAANQLIGVNAANDALECKSTINVILDDSAAQFKDASEATALVKINPATVGTHTISPIGAYEFAYTLTGATTVTFPTTGTLAILGANTFTGNQTLDDGTGNSPTLTFTDATDETAVFEKVDSGYLTITTQAADGVNILTGNLKVGNGSPGQTINGEDAYIEGLLEVDGVIYADGGITGATANNPYIKLDETDGTDWWIGVNDTTTDVLEIRTNATAGSNVGMNIDASGNANFTAMVRDVKLITAKTADYTVTAADMGGVLTNAGDDGTAIFTLPEASTVLGRTITFVVLATQVLNINPADGTDQILYGGCAAGDSLQADAIGETIVLMAVTANQWAVLSLVGTWTDAD